MPLTFGDLLLDSAGRYPNKKAIIEGSKSLTYRELLLEVTKCQHELLSKNKTIIAIFLPNSIEYVISFFSASMLGAIIMPVYWKLSSHDVNIILNKAGVELIITNTLGKEKINNNAFKYHLIHSVKNSTDTATLKLINKEKTNTSLILQTSGTTSTPKFVGHSFSSIVSNLKAHIKSLNLCNKDTVLIVLPMPFGYCNTSQFLAHIYLGSTLVIYDRKMADPRYLLKLIEKNEVSTFTAVPTLLKSFTLLREDIFQNFNLSSLKYICFGGGAVSSEIITAIKKRFNQTKLVQTYGQTEAGPRITTKFIENDYDMTNVGKPLEGVSIKIIAQNKKLKVNEVGEVYIKSKSLMNGYFRDPESTKRVLSNGLLKTGDLGYLDQNHELHIVGRVNNTIKVNGIRVSPEEIEEILKGEFNQIKEMIVKGEKHPLYGEIPVAFIVPIEFDSAETLIQKIMEFCNNHLSSYKIPRKINIVEEIQKTATGKLKRS
ncbi:acyl--CoA ligase [Bacillus aquiflavi]|uniref:Acyl--CoA ligase n=1 Tax=Bacillus aquiflavi TaxID=2672567 RepID=A0A6B3VUU3_9BACI|nr:class I adenylate-forming enzyme family protein [Bacillus aquiflavi]MBA4536374.1 acyl--CoA ligase [Bacillus aquiflavi]NEY80742.1 acyl--CoA ligase [Bacillus aquiflavi]